MDYIEMVVPFEVKPFDDMNKRETEQYFRWFLVTMDERIGHLQSFIEMDGQSFILDKTPESLVRLWKWFEPHIITEQQSEEEIQEEIKRLPDWMKENILNHTKEISLHSRKIAYDISAYFGEVVVHNNPSIQWGYLTKPKRLDGRNAPSLVGFKDGTFVYVYGRIEVCMWKYIRQKKQNLFMDLYQIVINHC